eukprot:jgi/Psemu1/28016/gm1.28016_g
MLMLMMLQAIESYNNLDATQATKQYKVNQGIKIFGEEGIDAVLSKLQQLHDRGIIEMVWQSLQYLMFVKRKRTGKVKGRGCADGRPQRKFITKEDSTSPTVSLYALMLSCMIDAVKGRDVASVDIPRAFLQTDMPEGEDVYIKLDGTMAKLLCCVDPKLYGPNMITMRNGKKTLIGKKARKAIFGTLWAALLFWQKLSSELVRQGYKPSPYG